MFRQKEFKFEITELQKLRKRGFRRTSEFGGKEEHLQECLEKEMVIMCFSSFYLSFFEKMSAILVQRLSVPPNRKVQPCWLLV